MPCMLRHGDDPPTAVFSPHAACDSSASCACWSCAGLTLAQMLDLDVEALAVKIDRQHSYTKKVILVRGA